MTKTTPEASPQDIAGLLDATQQPDLPTDQKFAIALPPVFGDRMRPYVPDYPESQATVAVYGPQRAINMGVVVVSAEVPTAGPAHYVELAYTLDGRATRLSGELPAVARHGCYVLPEGRSTASIDLDLKRRRDGFAQAPATGRRSLRSLLRLAKNERPALGAEQQSAVSSTEVLCLTGLLRGLASERARGSQSSGTTA